MSLLGIIVVMVFFVTIMGLYTYVMIKDHDLILANNVLLAGIFTLLTIGLLWMN